MPLRSLRAALALSIAGILICGMGCGTKSYRCPTKGMMPTLYVDDIFRAELHPYRNREMARGDIIVFSVPAVARLAQGKLFFKRVIGLPGEMIEIKDYQVFIDGQELGEPYIQLPESLGFDPSELRNTERQLIPANHCFVLGDNRGNSYDSRHFGPISCETIVARAVVITRSRHEGQKGKDLTKVQGGG